MEKSPECEVATFRRVPSVTLVGNLRGYLSQWNSNPLGLLFLSTVIPPKGPQF